MENKDGALLRVENLCQYFKLGGSELKAVDNVSFEIKSGEVFGLVGESGCGKTTTGRTVIKLYNATSGNVWYKGRRICAGTRSYEEKIKQLKSEYADLRKKSEKLSASVISDKKHELNKQIAEQKKLIAAANHDQKYCDREYAREELARLKSNYESKIARASPEKANEIRKEYAEARRLTRKRRFTTQIQMIFQDSIASLNPRMTVREIISEGLKIRGVRDKKYIDQKVFEVLERVGLVREHAGRYPHEFSGGQRQRIGVARSIIMDPGLIIADEPISALDVSIQAQVINLLNELRHELGLTILFIAHNLSIIKYFSDRIAVMYSGHIVELAPSEELFAHPLHPYTNALLANIPRPDPFYEKGRKRKVYNQLADHDYTTETPLFREIVPGHFVMCSDSEYKKYIEQYKNK
jgi:ATPase components of various ABC-type transport systems, contain duplicated ATPase